jgi:uncharacterized protein YneF (UPF0154 family)
MNALIGIHVFTLSGLVVMFIGYYIAKRKNGN